MQRHLLHLQYLRLLRQTHAGESSASELEDGTYTADFNTDSNMFHVNEAKEGKGVLTVKDGKMTIHVSLVSKNIVNVFVGTKEEAQADGAELIEPTTDEVRSLVKKEPGMIM